MYAKPKLFMKIPYRIANEKEYFLFVGQASSNWMHPPRKKRAFEIIFFGNGTIV